jgi:uncharacterized repeat protein (TIGR01451 family)
LALLTARAGVLVVLVAMVVGLTASASAQVGPATLLILKTADKSIVRPGDVITYTITMSNTGPGSLDVTMTDALPYGVLFVPGSLTPGAIYAAGQVTWSGTLGVGASKEIVFRVEVVEPGTGGPLPIVNQACVNGGTGMVCSSVTTVSNWPVYLPIILRSWRSSG